MSSKISLITKQKDAKGNIRTITTSVKKTSTCKSCGFRPRADGSSRCEVCTKEFKK